MDFIFQLEKLIDNDPRFVDIKNSPNMKTILLKAVERIYASGRIKDSCYNFLRGQRDIHRYVEIAKKIAGNSHSKQYFPRAYEDDSINEQVMRDDLMAFYYELDQMTGGKHKFVEKVSRQLSKTTFILGEGRPSVGTTYDNKGNIIESHIEIFVEPIVNSRISPMHEEWHAIDEKNFNGGGHEQDQFLGEIGTTFIDKIARDFIVKTHCDEPQLVEKIRLLDMAKNDIMIDKARESYLDYLLVMSIVGKPEEQLNANSEIVKNFGRLWGINDIRDKIEHLYYVALGDPKKHFDPMYELRYVVGDAVAQAVYDSKKMSISDKIDRMATFNENLLHTENLDISSQSPLDRVTTFLGVDNVDLLIENMASQLSQQHIKY